MRTPSTTLLFALSFFVARSFSTPVALPNDGDIEGPSAEMGTTEETNKFGECSRPLEERREWSVTPSNCYKAYNTHATFFWRIY